MSLKIKLVSLVSMFILVVIFLFVGVFALPQTEIMLGGSISFMPTDVRAKISGKISGTSQGEISFNTLVFSEDPNDNPSSETDINTWKNRNIKFNDLGEKITLTLTVENLSQSKNLYVKINDNIGAITNLTKKVYIQGNENNEILNNNIKVTYPTPITFIFEFVIDNLNQEVGGEFDYMINLLDASQVEI